MHSLQSAFLADMGFSARDVATLRALGEYRGKRTLYARQRPETLAALRAEAVIESADSSNRLEGITTSAVRLMALVEQTTTPRDRSEQEIVGYRDAWDSIHQRGRKMPVTVNVIRQLHQTLFHLTPDKGGQWKDTGNEFVEKDAQGIITRILFRGLPAKATPQAVDDLIVGYEKALAEGNDPMVVTPLVILDFLCICPFHSGNGRVARLLMLLLLIHAGYEVGQYISLERLLEKNREPYYDSLEASSQGWRQGEHDALPWLDYFWDILIHAYQEFEERAGQLDGARSSKSERVREAVSRKVAPFKIVDLERDCPGVSRETIRLVLREMKAEGLVRAEGRGRGARWIKIDV
jgi:Fic family protein